jgi:hypothetical protein
MLLHPMAETLRHNKQVSKSGAEFAIANPNDQKHKEMHIAKNILFKDAFGFMLMIYNPKNK